MYRLYRESCLLLDGAPWWYNYVLSGFNCCEVIIQGAIRCNVYLCKIKT